MGNLILLFRLLLDKVWVAEGGAGSDNGSKIHIAHGVWVCWYLIAEIVCQRHRSRPHTIDFEGGNEKLNS